MPDDEPDSVETPGEDLRDVLGMPPRRAPAVLAPGQIIDDAYRIEEEIGAGGMGRVYRAHDLRLARDVALKLHGFALAPDDDTLRREATALARLTHANVVTVYEVGTWNGHPWVAMAYVPGGTVRTWLRAQTRTPREILAVFIAAGRGLEAAHAAGLVHRDFKPDNVLVGDDGRICVADFGLARDAGSSESHVGDIVGSPALPLATRTKTGAIRGTPAYMAPEQRDGTRVDATADQYAFAVSLWEALTGARPFAEDNKTVIAPPSGSMPRHVEVALRRGFAIARGERWPSMAALIDELARDPARTRFIIAVSLIAMVALVGGGYAVAVRRQHASAPVCEATNELASMWSTATGDAMRVAYPGELGERMTASIDTWVERWQHERIAVCRDGTTQAAPLLALRETCLDRARTRLGATLDVLRAGVSPVNALTLSTSLPRLADCADATALAGVGVPPVDPAAIASMHAAEAMLAQVETWVKAGDFARAAPLAKDALAYAERLGLPDLSARAQMIYAGALYSAGALEGILDRYEVAVRLAAAAHDDVLVATVYLAMLQLVTRLEKAGEIDRVLSATTTAIARANNPPILAEQLVAKRADIARLREDDLHAIPLYEQTAAAYEARYGKDQDLARTLTTLAQIYTRLHRHEEAKAALSRAAAIMHDVYGDLHPNLGVILTALGDVEADAGDLDHAIETYHRAIALKEKTLGPENRGLAGPLVNLALALTLRVQLPEAIATARRALAIVEKSFPPNHPKIALVLNTLGDAQRIAGDWKGAAESIDRAVAIFPTDSTDPGLSDPLRAQALIRRHEGKMREARVSAVRALALTSALDPSSIHTARARLILSQIDRDPAAFDAAAELIRRQLGATHPEVLDLTRTRAEVFGPTKPSPP